MKTALVVSSLRMGGTERVVSTMANHWAAKSWEVAVVTIAGREERPFFDLDPGVELIPLGVAGLSRSVLAALASNATRVRAVRRALATFRPDAVISFGDSTNVVAWLAAQGLRIPIVLSQRIDPSKYDQGPIWRWLRDFVCPRADALVVQNSAARAYFPSARERTIVIPNPVTPPDTQAKSFCPPLQRPAIVAMGRLAPQKGYDMLISTYLGLRSQFPEWRLVIVGDGPLRAELQAEIARLGLEEVVTLTGAVKAPSTVLMQGDIFALTSRFEGFPNALCEAMACGLPAVSFDCPSGPSEIIRHGVDGLLVPAGDVGALADALARLMANEAERRRMGERAREVVDRFGIDRVMEMWEELLRRVVA